MAQEQFLRQRRLVRRIADSVRKFVQEQGWDPDEYRLCFRVDPVWETISVILVAKEAAGQDEYALHASVKKVLKEELADIPGLADATSIVVTDPLTFENGLLRDVAKYYEDYKDYWGFSTVRQ